MSLLLKHSLGLRYYGALRSRLGAETREARDAHRNVAGALCVVRCSAARVDRRASEAATQSGPTPYPTRAEDWPGKGVVRVFGWMKDNRKFFWSERDKKQGSIVFAGDSLDRQLENAGRGFLRHAGGESRHRR